MYNHEAKEMEESKMICCKATIILNKPLPVEENRFGRNIYKKDIIDLINEATESINVKFKAERCCFVAGNSKQKLTLGVVVSEGNTAEDMIKEFMKKACISGTLFPR